MFRACAGRRLTPFLLTRYLESDWRQPASREEDAEQASQRLTSLVRAQLATTAGGGATNAKRSSGGTSKVAALTAEGSKDHHDNFAGEGDGIASNNSSSTQAATKNVASSSSSAALKGAPGANDCVDGANDFSAGLEEELDALTADERDTFDAFDASSMTLPMREARWLLNVFTKSGRIDDAALVISSIRKWNRKYFEDAAPLPTQNQSGSNSVTTTAGNDDATPNGATASSSVASGGQLASDSNSNAVLAPLSPYHLNCFLRLLLHHREKDAAVQLLDVMAKQRMVDADTISICVTGLHTVGTRERWSRILALVDAATVQQSAATAAAGAHLGGAGRTERGGAAALLAHQTCVANFIPLAVPNAREAADVAAVWPRPPRRVQSELQVAGDMLRLRQPRRWALTDVDPEPPLQCAIRTAERRHVAAASKESEDHLDAHPLEPTTKEAVGALMHSPILSALLAAAAAGPEGPVAAMLCAFWIKAIGAELTAMDYFHLLMAAQRCRTEALDVVFQVFGRDATCPHGCVSLDGIERRLKLMSSISSPSSSATAATSSVGATADTAGNFGRSRGQQQQQQQQQSASTTLHHQAPITSSAHAVDHAMELLPLVRASLRQHGVGSGDPIYLGFTNMDRAVPMADVRDFTDAVFDEVHRRPTVGAFGEAPTNIHHAHLLLLSQTRVDCAAPLVGFRARVRSWRARFGRAGAETPETPAMTAERAAWIAEQRATSERLRGIRGYSTLYAAPLVPGADTALYGSPALLKDVAVQFPRAGRHLHERVAAAYDDLCADVRSDADEVDVAVCWALGLPLVHDPAERRSVIDFVLAAALSRSPLRSIRQMMRGLLTMLAADPPRHLRPAAASAVAEREQWARYFEARDAALALFGQTKAGREAMRAIFMQHGQIPPMRGGDAIRADQEAAAALFEYDAGDLTRRPRLTKPLLTTPTGGTLPLVPVVATRPPGMKDPFRRLEGVQFAARPGPRGMTSDVPPAAAALASGQRQPLALPPSTAGSIASSTATSIVAPQFAAGNGGGGILAAAAGGAGAVVAAAGQPPAAVTRMINPTAFDALAAGADPLAILHAQTSYGVAAQPSEAPSPSAAATSVAGAHAHARHHAERLRLDASEMAAIEDSRRHQDSNPAATHSGAQKSRGSATPDENEDPFDRVRAAMQKIQDKWWLTEPDTALNYVLLLLQRYEWTEAIEVMKVVKVKQGFSASHDHDLQKAFDTIGDPAGAQCFKFAAQLIDGRISDNEAPGAVRAGYSGHTPKKQSLFTP